MDNQVQQLQQSLQQALQKNPQMVQQLVQEIESSGANAEDLQQMHDVAIQCFQNPQIYGQIRQQLIQSQQIDASDLPEKFDEKIVACLAIAAQIGLEHLKGKGSQPQPLTLPQGI